MGKNVSAVQSDSQGSTSFSTADGVRTHRRQLLWDCIYKIPICGGFCAPTLSTEPSFLRRFSNEKTVICFVVFWKFLSIFEQNKLCYWIGPIGFKLTPRMRKVVMGTAFVLAVISSVLITISIAGNSTDAATLRRFPWAYGHGGVRMGDEPLEAHFYVGIMQRLVDVDVSSSQMAVIMKQNFSRSYLEESLDLGAGRWRLSFSKPWETGCEFLDPNFSVDAAYCTRCYDSMTSSIGFAIMMLITNLTSIYLVFVVACCLNVPTIATDCQRITEYGDLNCQKFFGIFCAFIGIYGCLDGVAKFRFGCIDELPHQLSVPGSSTAVSLVWTLGSCWHYFLWGGLLKIVDSAVHFFVRTPNGRHAEITPKATSLGHFLRTYGSRDMHLQSEVSSV